jgi:hypothetical protein
MEDLVLNFSELFGVLALWLCVVLYVADCCDATRVRRVQSAIRRAKGL